MNFAEKARGKLKSEIFTEEDLKICFFDSTTKAIYNGISRSLHSKEFLKLKRGLYVFGTRYQKGNVSQFAIANKMYTPSYVSFESALSFHNLIPEAVYITTSACQLRKKKEFTTHLGKFSYDYIPCSPFFAGVESQKNSSNTLVADAIKALFDLIYVRRLKYDSLKHLEEDLRIDLNEFKTHVDRYTVKDLESLAQSYKKKNVTQFFQTLVRGMK